MHKAIDIHGHFGNPERFPQSNLEKEMYRISLESLKKNYVQQGITAACISPMEGIFPDNTDALLDANCYMEELAEEQDWIYQWVIVNPLMPASFHQAEKILKNRKCVGVKIHPDAHGYSIEAYGKEVFAFCNENHTLLLSHSGETLSMPEQFVPFADMYPTVSVIVAHLGCGSDGDIGHQIRAIKQASYGNIYTDVSSARSILNGLIEWAVRNVTAEKLLFGTDTPLHHIPMMKQRMEFAELSKEEKECIFYKNAMKWLPKDDSNTNNEE